MAAHELVVKLNLYEPAASVPLLVRGPDIPQGETRSQLASGVDILPTLCDLAGVEIPSIAGESLLPAIADRGQDQGQGREFVVSQLYPDTQDLSLAGRMLRSRDHKYLCFNSGERPEMLFHLGDDPGECHNLALAPVSPSALGQHREWLKRWLRASADPFQSAPLN